MSTPRETVARELHMARCVREERDPTDWGRLSFNETVWEYTWADRILAALDLAGEAVNAIEKVIEAGRAVMELTGRKQDFWSDDDYESLNDFDVALAALRTRAGTQEDRGEPVQAEDAIARQEQDAVSVAYDVGLAMGQRLAPRSVEREALEAIANYDKHDSDHHYCGCHQVMRAIARRALHPEAQEQGE